MFKQIKYKEPKLLGSFFVSCVLLICFKIFNIMKKVLLAFSITLGAFYFTACSSSPEGAAATTEAAQEVVEAPAAATVSSLPVDVANSSVNWKGTKPGGSHVGTISIKEGELSVAENAITGGKFTIDMTTINTTDLEAGKGKEKLDGHLANGDFFQIDSFPTATFEITAVEALATADAAGNNSSISGNLTLKGITNNITFPANVTVSETEVDAVAPQFTIDRTKWNVQYGSKSIFDNLGDKFINDQIGIAINLKATK